MNHFYIMSYYDILIYLYYQVKNLKINDHMHHDGQYYENYIIKY
jgi:hypothetical protein